MIDGHDTSPVIPEKLEELDSLTLGHLALEQERENLHREAMGTLLEAVQLKLGDVPAHMSIWGGHGKLEKGEYDARPGDSVRVYYMYDPEENNLAILRSGISDHAGQYTIRGGSATTTDGDAPLFSAALDVTFNALTGEYGGNYPTAPDEIAKISTAVLRSTRIDFELFCEASKLFKGDYSDEAIKKAPKPERKALKAHRDRIVELLAEAAKSRANHSDIKMFDTELPPQVF